MYKARNSDIVGPSLGATENWNTSSQTPDDVFHVTDMTRSSFGDTPLLPVLYLSCNDQAPHPPSHTGRSSDVPGFSVDHAREACETLGQDAKMIASKSTRVESEGFKQLQV